MTEEVDFVDLVWHECEFREGYSFSYAVYDDRGDYLGCGYLYPVGRRTELSAQLIEHDVDVSWWVTPEAYDRGHYAGLYRALRTWVTEAFPFTAPHYSNREIPPLNEGPEPCEPSATYVAGRPPNRALCTASTAAAGPLTSTCAASCRPKR